MVTHGEGEAGEEYSEAIAAECQEWREGCFALRGQRLHGCHTWQVALTL